MSKIVASASRCGRPRNNPARRMQWDSVPLDRAQGTREKIDHLASVLSKEKGVKVPAYVAVEVAVSEALERRKEGRP